jgi:hypothetical protein
LDILRKDIMLKENESKIKELDEKLKKSNMLVLLNKLKNETNSNDEENNNEEKSNDNKKDKSENINRIDVINSGKTKTELEIETEKKNKVIRARRRITHY